MKYKIEYEYLNVEDSSQDLWLSKSTDNDGLGYTLDEAFRVKAELKYSILKNRIRHIAIVEL